MIAGLNPEKCIGPSFNRELYNANGFYIVKNLLPPDLVQEMRSSIPDIMTNVVGQQRKEGKGTHTFFMYKDSTPSIAEKVYTSPTLLDLVETIVGKDIVLYLRRFVVKDDVFTEGVPLHHDAAYQFGTMDKLAVFVPFDATDEASGSIGFLAGSHKLGYLSGVPSMSIDLTDEELNIFPPYIPTLEPGDVVLYDYQTFHFSYRTKTNKRRLVMQLVYQPATDGSGWDSEVVRGKWQTDVIYKNIFPRKINTTTLKTEATIRHLYLENQKLQAEIDLLRKNTSS